MFSVVLLENCGTKIIVKHTQCEIFHKPNASVLMNGVNPHELTKIFFSPRHEKPCFTTETRHAPFDRTKTAIYNGFVLRSFGNYAPTFYFHFVFHTIHYVRIYPEQLN